MDAEAYLREWAARVEEELGRRVPERGGAPPEMYRVMRYSLLAGGKRLRPVLCAAGAEAVGGDPGAVLPAACALECIHTYSLIHDDLPAMDDDDLRRGLPTNHKVHGEAAAILAGDGLLTLAFGLMADEEMVRRAGAGRVLEGVRMLAEAAGAPGMVGGQLLDIRAGGKVSAPRELEEIHRLKTGAMIRCSVSLGGLLGGGDAGALRALARYGERAGLAFQIVDDILNVEGSPEQMGKAAGSDAAHGKAAYPALHGLEASKRMAREACEEALAALSPLPGGAPALAGLVRFIVLRRS
ncbi:MAG: polyprenyl synthetase family protein [Candidatus Tectomicrobia bacterium]|uniref:Polyprenyl synthetase family protein n=1 Tax=Tectimicrobiota bacterium TaxID=2528274 RepID=A0A932MND6_UNCTE|nr:polyprenyl synthetase family protein [Candidatus Tectomicrobia bacterium]